jgi:hypothetical protein
MYVVIHISGGIISNVFGYENEPHADDEMARLAKLCEDCPDQDYVAKFYIGPNDPIGIYKGSLPEEPDI